MTAELIRNQRNNTLMAGSELRSGKAQRKTDKKRRKNHGKS
jgi:hypothetical protein